MNEEPGNRPQQMRFLSTFTIWAKSMNFLKAHRLQVLWIAGLGMFLPQFLANLYLDQLAVQRAIKFKQLGLSLNPTIWDFASLLGEVAPSFVSTMFLIYLMILTSYFVMTSVSQHPVADLGVAVKPAAMRALRSSVPLLVLVVLFSFVAQLFFLISFVLGALSLMVPVLMVAENQGALRACQQSFTMSFAKNTGFSTWHVLFSLMLQASLLIAAFILVSMGKDYFLNLDSLLGFRHAFWAEGMMGQPFSWAYMTYMLFENLAASFLFVFAATVFGTIYKTLKNEAA